MGTAPARFAVERREWTEAAALAAPANPPAGRHAWAQANLYYARGLGAARLGKADAAQREQQALAAMRDSLEAANEKYWAEQTEIQREVVSAWVSWARGNREEALRQMRAAADHEDATDKHPVTPGVIVPARELLGEMLLELQQPAGALEAFEATLRGAPKRFNALAGAARAAERAGDSAKSARYSAELVEICGRADAPRPALARAKEFLAAKGHD
jgi:tetratricopeptide (TPR) repeat protein